MYSSNERGGNMPQRVNQPGISTPRDRFSPGVHRSLASTPLFVFLYAACVRTCERACRKCKEGRENGEEKLRRSCTHPRAGASLRRAKPGLAPDSPVVRSRASRPSVPAWLLPASPLRPFCFSTAPFVCTDFKSISCVTSPPATVRTVDSRRSVAWTTTTMPSVSNGTRCLTARNPAVERSKQLKTGVSKSDFPLEENRSRSRIISNVLSSRD